MARFVIIDDSKMARFVLRNLLEEKGHEVVAEADDGKHGFDLYKQYQPDIIALDIVMAEVGGIECLKLIKESYPDAKIIMVSSVGKEKTKEESMAIGATCFITKPIDADELFAAINQIL